MKTRRHEDRKAVPGRLGVLGVLVFVLLSVVSSLPVVARPYSTLDEYVFRNDTIESVIRSTAEYQLNRYGPNIPTKNWLVGTFFSSFVAAYDQTGDEWYLEQALKWGEASEWDINNSLNADDICPGQTYLDLYFIKGGEEKFAILQKKLSTYFGRETIKPGELHEWDKAEKPFIGRNIWYWCDALYMAPPVYARMGKATGDKRYHEQMHDLYWDTIDFLYDEEEQLVFRDAKYLSDDVRTPNGKKVFWSRGNGWVIGGLARLIPFLSEDDPKRADYIELFQTLSFSIAKYQQADGLWRSSLNDPEWHPTKETSGSAFFVYAMAKGINEGWLPREYFMPIVLKGWRGLVDCVSPDGRLGYGQLVAGSPHAVRAEDSLDYAVGAFILAGVEMLKLNALEEMKVEHGSVFKPRLVVNDGAWTWYNDERVIFHNNVFYANYVKRNGKTAMTAFGLDRMPSSYARYEYILSTWNQSDDHNNGALLPLKDGNLLATYAGHGMDNNFYQRKLKLNRWSEADVSDERKFEMVRNGNGLTYQNLYCLEDEDGRIYNFFRGDNFNPNFVISDDDAETWSKPIHLILSGKNNSHRPYVKYVSNGKDRIDFFYTDGHPRNSKQNNIYHFYYKAGVFYNSANRKLRTMKELKSRPIRVDEGTSVFDGSSPNGRGWVWDLEYDQEGLPMGAFISSPSGDMGTDMRYWVARLKDGQWICEQVAYAGSNLYEKEEHYAGGIALDPFNEQRVVVSADVHPGSGEPLPKRVYQLFKGTCKNGKWEWEQLTHDPVNNHLRPVLVRGRENALFWLAGEYIWYGDYHCNILMSMDF